MPLDPKILVNAAGTALLRNAASDALARNREFPCDDPCLNCACTPSGSPYTIRLSRKDVATDGTLAVRVDFGRLRSERFIRLMDSNFGIEQIETRIDSLDTTFNVTLTPDTLSRLRRASHGLRCRWQTGSDHQDIQDGRTPAEDFAAPEIPTSVTDQFTADSFGTSWVVVEQWATPAGSAYAEYIDQVEFDEDGELSGVTKAQVDINRVKLSMAYRIVIDSVGIDSDRENRTNARVRADGLGDGTSAPTHGPCIHIDVVVTGVELELDESLDFWRYATVSNPFGDRWADWTSEIEVNRSTHGLGPSLGNPLVQVSEGTAPNLRAVRFTSGGTVVSEIIVNAGDTEYKNGVRVARHAGLDYVVTRLETTDPVTSGYTWVDPNSFDTWSFALSTWYNSWVDQDWGTEPYLYNNLITGAVDQEFLSADDTELTDDWVVYYREGAVPEYVRSRSQPREFAGYEGLLPPQFNTSAFGNANFQPPWGAFYNQLLYRALRIADTSDLETIDAVDMEFLPYIGQSYTTVSDIPRCPLVSFSYTFYLGSGTNDYVLKWGERQSDYRTSGDYPDHDEWDSAGQNSEIKSSTVHVNTSSVTFPPSDPSFSLTFESEIGISTDFSLDQNHVPQVLDTSLGAAVPFYAGEFDGERPGPGATTVDTTEIVYGRCTRIQHLRDIDSFDVTLTLTDSVFDATGAVAHGLGATPDTPTPDEPATVYRRCNSECEDIYVTKDADTRATTGPEYVISNDELYYRVTHARVTSGDLTSGVVETDVGCTISRVAENCDGTLSILYDPVAAGSSPSLYVDTELYTLTSTEVESAPNTNVVFTNDLCPEVVEAYKCSDDSGPVYVDLNTRTSSEQSKFTYDSDDYYITATAAPGETPLAGVTWQSGLCSATLTAVRCSTLPIEAGSTSYNPPIFVPYDAADLPNNSSRIIRTVLRTENTGGGLPFLIEMTVYYVASNAPWGGVSIDPYTVHSQEFITGGLDSCFLWDGADFYTGPPSSDVSPCFLYPPGSPFRPAYCDLGQPNNPA